MNIPANELKSILKKLSGVKTEFFQVEPGLIRAQDSDVWVEIASPIFTDQTPFSVSKKIIQDVNRFSGDLEIERQEFKLVLKSKKATREIAIQPTKTTKRPQEPCGCLSLPLGDVKDLLTLAANTVSNKKSQDYGDVVQFKTGGFVSIEDSRPSFLQTIGFDSVVMTRVRRSVVLDAPFDSLVNLSAIPIVHLLDGDMVEFGQTDSGVWFKTPTMIVVSAKPSKKYPDNERHIPAKHAVQFSFDPVAAAQALKVVEPDDSSDGSVGLHFSDGVLQLFSVGASDEIEYEQNIPDADLEPIDYITRVNYKHLSGILHHSTGSVVLSASSSEGILRFDSGDVTTLAASMYRKGK